MTKSIIAKCSRAMMNHCRCGQVRARVKVKDYSSQLNQHVWYSKAEKEIAIVAWMIFEDISDLWVWTNELSCLLIYWYEENWILSAMPSGTCSYSADTYQLMKKVVVRLNDKKKEMKSTGVTHASLSPSLVRLPRGQTFNHDDWLMRRKERRVHQRINKRQKTWASLCTAARSIDIGVSQNNDMASSESRECGVFILIETSMFTGCFLLLMGLKVKC